MSNFYYMLYEWKKICKVAKKFDYVLDDHSLYDAKLRTSNRSGYLMKEGSEKDNTWHSKPELSFRIASHWNWYANTAKAPADYIQCFCPEFGSPNKRSTENPTHATTPIYRTAICFFKDGFYHVFAGWNGTEFKMPSDREIEEFFAALN